MHQYFVKITPKLDYVSCGDLEILKSKTKRHYHIKDAKADIFEYEYALETIATQIQNLNTQKKKTLFYIHGFWSSLSYPFFKATNAFQNEYFKAEDDTIAAVVHIVWDAGSLYYRNCIDNLQKSKATLSDILKQLNHFFGNEISIMCHSMGNRFLYETLMLSKIEVRFKELIMLAPDLNYTFFENEHAQFSAVTTKVFVLYHTKDNTLWISKFINKEERLGRLKLRLDNAQVRFVDLSTIDDIRSIPDKLMRHNYFLNSTKARLAIEACLK